MTVPTHRTVAIIDIGSNSIKILVATRAPSGGLRVLKSHTIDARISAGISREHPRLTAAAIETGLDAIQALLAEAAPFAPDRIVLVATSAVRDAENGADFRARVRTATGHDIRILAGEEEADLIGRGLTTDPALAGLRDFYVFDLGGGSLECLAFRARRIERAASLPLGCVRLTEKFVADPTGPFPVAARAAVAAHTRATLATVGFNFPLPSAAAAVGTGGTVTVARAILAHRLGRTLDASEPEVTVGQLHELLDWLGDLPLAKRKLVSGLPPTRADVMPTAIATLIAVAEAGGIDRYRHSFYNLRYGLAAAALELET
jgi:exopolyphosphatase/guanosine-5'-triphosphate,3'-diphosphate pyrophosphatase